MRNKIQVHNLKHLKKFRKRLRKQLTPAEAFLWKEITSRKFHNLKFRRQHSIHNYIVDFYCAQHQLIIELDGQYHDEPNQLEQDNKSDAYLNSSGFHVLRYENKYIFEHLDLVLKEIKQHCEVDI
ncbi:MAG: endonuclease domain-containing protein [Nonlabens sp.]|uniref:endonuclease domain-containing protein n=1 Tax=Nonlabens sp. TaxID=1888209 RepID=UPI003EF62F31